MGGVCGLPCEAHMITVMLILVVAAFICTVLAGTGYPPPLWVGVLLLCVVELLRVLPVGR